MKTNHRYKRQIVLPEIGIEGQGKIANTSVLCIGAGGLGCPALLYLVAAGVGHIGIVDFDVVDETNLQRQIIFTTEQIGQNKAEAATKRLTALNPNIKIQPYPEELTDKNAERLFNKYDIIIDGTDNFSTKFLINDAAIKTGKPFIYGSILGFDGQVSIFGMPNRPCYRCLFPEPPKGHVPNCTEAGIIGAVAGIVGTTQAMEAIKLIVGHESFKPLIGKIWSIDMHSMENKLLSLSKNPACAVCSKEKEEIILNYASPVCEIVSEITAKQAQQHNDALIIDVREIDEWNAGHIENSQHIALSSLMQGHTPNLPTNRDIILYCQIGQRSLQAAQILKSQGYINIINMSDGYIGWLKLA
jgi:adenylyltransferase/sulfurtransferase